MVIEINDKIKRMIIYVFSLIFLVRKLSIRTINERLMKKYIKQSTAYLYIILLIIVQISN